MLNIFLWGGHGKERTDVIASSHDLQIERAPWSLLIHWSLMPLRKNSLEGGEFEEGRAIIFMQLAQVLPVLSPS
jgi:hypothetical protein